MRCGDRDSVAYPRPQAQRATETATNACLGLLEAAAIVGTDATMTANLLPIPDDPRLTQLFETWTDGTFQTIFPRFPRSVWLSYFEDVLRETYPQSSSADRKLTARHAAPFPLAAGPNVP